VIVVDTSVWMEHIRGGRTPLAQLLGSARVLLHPFVFGELLLHGLPRKGPLSTSLSELEAPPVATTEETAAFIVWAKLAGTGVGYVDAHLLVSARMIPGGKLLTRDNKLHAQAERLDVAYVP
jgi:predicted nucleic acid-binding protein